jgi:hypothetical protein
MMSPGRPISVRMSVPMPGRHQTEGIDEAGSTSHASTIQLRQARKRAL